MAGVAQADGEASFYTPEYDSPATNNGIAVGRDSGSSVTPAYVAPFPFTGGTIDKVVVDVSGEAYLDHEAQVRTWFSLD